MMRLVAGLIVSVCLLISTGAGASEQSERLYSRGLVDFHTGRYTQALTLFQRAVDADPDDVYARYYRGVIYARLNDFAAAATDLRRVVAKHPNLAQAKLELGMALVQGRAYQEARGPDPGRSPRRKCRTRHSRSRHRLTSSTNPSHCSRSPEAWVSTSERVVRH
jgi:Flp pilus assembly protein TadD